MNAPPVGSIVRFEDGEVYFHSGNNLYIVIHGTKRGTHKPGQSFTLSSEVWGHYEIVIPNLFSSQIDWETIGKDK